MAQLTIKSALKKAITDLGGEPVSNTVSGLILELSEILGGEEEQETEPVVEEPQGEGGGT